MYIGGFRMNRDSVWPIIETIVTFSFRLMERLIDVRGDTHRISSEFRCKMLIPAIETTQQNT